MTIYDSVNDIKEMLFGEKDVGFDSVRASIHRELGKDSISIPPQYMMMKITNYCNSDCVYCNHARSKAANESKNSISLEHVQSIISQAIELGVKAISISGGEPLVRSDVEQMVQHIAENNVVPVLLTNGSMLKERASTLYESGLRYFIISLDSLDEEEYSAQRGMKIEPVLEGIEAVKKLMEKDSGVKLHITPVVTAKNILRMPEMVRYFSAQGISVQFSPYHRFVFNRKDDLAAFHEEDVNQTIDTLLQMKEEDYLIANSAAFLRHFKDFMCKGDILPAHYNCLAGYSTIYVDTYENVLPCWSGGIGVVGSLKTSSLSEIWYGRDYAEIRKRMLACQCAGCWLLCTGELTMLINGED